jgi:hypothetical protein
VVSRRMEEDAAARACSRSSSVCTLRRSPAAARACTDTPDRASRERETSFSARNQLRVDGMRGRSSLAPSFSFVLQAIVSLCAYRHPQRGAAAARRRRADAQRALVTASRARAARRHSPTPRFQRGGAPGAPGGARAARPQRRAHGSCAAA